MLLVAKNEFTFGTYDGLGGFTTQGSNFAIYGDEMGVIDGSATEVQPVFTPVDLPGVPAGTLHYYKLDGGGPQGITVGGCDGVLIDSITVKDAANFAISLERCRKVTVRNPTVDTGNGNMINQTTGIPYKYNGKNQDGIHFTDCEDYEVI
jgi:polygalacturonase